MYRLAGIFFILAGCIGWGNGKVGQERDRIRHLRSLVQIFDRMQSEIAYGKHTLPEICLLLTTVREEHYSACFRRMYERSTEGDGTGIPRIWKEEFRDCLDKLPLREEERETVLTLPDHLCFQEGDKAGRQDRTGRRVSGGEMQAGRGNLREQIENDTQRQYSDGIAVGDPSAVMGINREDR